MSSFYIATKDGRLGFMLDTYVSHGVDGETLEVFLTNNQRQLVTYKTVKEAAAAAAELSESLDWSVGAKRDHEKHLAELKAKQKKNRTGEDE
jgi:hypothetical protein